MVTIAEISYGKQAKQDHTNSTSSGSTNQTSNNSRVCQKGRQIPMPFTTPKIMDTMFQTILAQRLRGLDQLFIKK
jgi:hypothetical protein